MLNGMRHADFRLLIGAALSMTVPPAGAFMPADASAQTPAPATALPHNMSDVIAQIQHDEIAYNKLPDSPGTGAYPAIKEEDATLPDHIVYRPRNLAALGRTKLSIVAWGNGGCSADGAAQRLHLLELASHGYLVVANGRILSGPGANAQAAPPQPTTGPDGKVKLPPPGTTSSQLTQSIDWAIAENARKGSPYHNKIDTNAIAVSGWSCGGVQALRIASSDPRVKTTVIHNSGLFPAAASLAMPGMDVDKSVLPALRKPIIYILGGPTDIAYENGMDDYSRVTGAPVAVANLAVGHAGTFMTPNGGRAAQVAVAWLDWRLKGDV